LKFTFFFRIKNNLFLPIVQPFSLWLDVVFFAQGFEIEVRLDQVGHDLTRFQIRAILSNAEHVTNSGLDFLSLAAESKQPAKAA
jgi:hypothetical protein